MWLIAAQADFWEFVIDDDLVAVTQLKDSSAQNKWERERVIGLIKTWSEYTHT